jgi:ferrochelatase
VLEPDIADHLTTLAKPAPRRVTVACPSSPFTSRRWGTDHELGSRAGASNDGARGHAERRSEVQRLAADLVNELRDGREPARVSGPDAPPLQGFSINGVVCTPNCG